MVNATIITTEPERANLALGTKTTVIENELEVETITPSNHFTTGLSADGLEPATHFIASGFWNDEELNILLNSEIDWTVTFGKEPSAVMEEAGLKMVQAEVVYDPVEIVE